MNLTKRKGMRRTRERGISLIECIVYLGLLFVIVELAFNAYNRTLNTSQQLRKNSDDVVASLSAGEMWRADLRSAVGTPKIVGDILEIPQAGKTISYWFHDGVVSRRSDKAPWKGVLSKVRKSEITKEAGTEVNAWRWELELQSKDSSPRIKPLFTFIAVAGGAGK